MQGPSQRGKINVKQPICDTHPYGGRGISMQAAIVENDVYMERARMRARKTVFGKKKHWKTYFKKCSDSMKILQSL